MPTDESRILFLPPTTAQEFYRFLEEQFLPIMGSSGDYDAGPGQFVTVHSELFDSNPYKIEVWDCSCQNDELIGSWLSDREYITFVSGRISLGDNTPSHHASVMGFFLLNAARVANRRLDWAELILS
ncbi:MAG: hypothetical protein A2Y57_00975 [Candidatus Woykebacteria bacterium RBG_13_40_7b]|uniref:Uncharacterized protein n=1 Tax=Candidatus Woykebacteria bacterium RBG_13_40_7b TaxID=1802594 RepID=A0A1G1WB00_9BACT|nr:MAG: hypothetical protein A2Y57_00975 [Candidatus Woykebacteria bacterium RBG_13_40_7b]